MKKQIIELENFDDFCVTRILASDTSTGRALKMRVFPITNIVSYQVLKNRISQFQTNDFKIAVEKYNAI